MQKASAAQPTSTTIPFDEFVRDLAAILDRLALDGEPVMVEHSGTRYQVEVAPPAHHEDQRLTRDDPLWELVGSATDAPPTDAAKKHEYLAEAYTPQP